MPKFSRAARALGLGLVGWMALVGASRGQAPAGSAPAAAPAPAAPAKIGSIDMDKVFKDYKKVKLTSEQLKNAAVAKQGELSKLMEQMKAIAQQLEAMAPGTGSFKEKEAEMTKLKIQLETEREQAQAEFARREAEELATIYKEVQ